MLFIYTLVLLLKLKDCNNVKKFIYDLGKVQERVSHDLQQQMVCSVGILDVPISMFYFSSSLA